MPPGQLKMLAPPPGNQPCDCRVGTSSPTPGLRDRSGAEDGVQGPKTYDFINHGSVIKLP